jgi:hypothetical protein
MLINACMSSSPRVRCDSKRIVASPSLAAAIQSCLPLSTLQARVATPATTPARHFLQFKTSERKANLAAKMEKLSASFSSKFLSEILERHFRFQFCSSTRLYKTLCGHTLEPLPASPFFFSHACMPWIVGKSWT